MHVTAGHLRGRKVPVPNVQGLRPTPSKVRQALFNILCDIEGWQMLDLFAGSGLMSIEGISRNIKQATSIEQNKLAIRNMHTIKQQFNTDAWRILPGTLPQALVHVRDSFFDLVFADPPYDKGIAACIPGWLDQYNIRCHYLVIEEASRASPDWPDNWQLEQSRRYGESNLHFLVPVDPSSAENP